MCGIAGFWTLDAGLHGEAGEAALRRMADAIAHRGPDADGYWSDAETGVGLAHRRLSILDLSPAGAQPMPSASGRHEIVFNGEIYNHLELRAALERDGAAPAWRGHSDTETLLAAIECWGVAETLPRLFGMFAFALWDRGERALWLARDRLGEKPLYYGWSGRTLLFGSELKALKGFPGFAPLLDRDAVAAYLRFGYVPCPHTIYQGVRKLPPAAYLRLATPAPGAAPPPQAYWSLKTIAESGTENRLAGGFEEAVQALEAVLGEVVSSQMLSDVPLGAFLSGGVDSSLITALMQEHSSRPVRTFSIGFEEARFNESAQAREVAKHLRTDHTAFMVTEADALALAAELPRIYDEPFADSSQLPTILLSRLTRQSVTVAMSGDGGDEMFGGYNRYLFGPKLWRRLGRLPAPARRGIALAASLAQRFGSGAGSGALSSLAARFGLPATTIDRLSKFGAALGRAQNIDGFYREIVSAWPAPGDILLHPREAPSLLDQDDPPALADAAERMMALDALTYLPDDILVKVDRAAMSASLETRAPFLDARVVELAWRLPMSAKISEGVGKRILREMLYRRVPRELIERPKQGFAVPLDAWLRGALRDWAETLLSRGRLTASGLFEADAVRAVWDDHLAGRDNAGARLWAVLMLQSWLEAP
jgi:asparagine synthase (glutamine-hydrolysing)